MSKFLKVISENIPQEQYDDMITAKLTLARAINGIDDFVAIPKQGTGIITIKTPAGDSFDVEIVTVKKVKQEEAEDEVDIDDTIEKMSKKGDESDPAIANIKKAVRDRENTLRTLMPKAIQQYNQVTQNLKKANIQ
jgi:hypothetical protein